MLHIECYYDDIDIYHYQAGKGRFQKKGEFLNTVNASSLPQIKAIFAAYPEVSPISIDNIKFYVMQ